MQWGYKRSLKLPLPPAVVSLLLHTETFRLSVTGSFQSMLPINKSSLLLKVSLEIFLVFFLHLSSFLWTFSGGGKWYYLVSRQVKQIFSLYPKSHKSHEPWCISLVTCEAAAPCLVALSHGRVKRTKE